MQEIESREGGQRERVKRIESDEYKKDIEHVLMKTKMPNDKL